MTEPLHEGEGRTTAFSSPWSIIKAATTAVPATRYALALAGTAVALAIAVQFVGGHDPAAIKATLVGVGGMLVLMTIMVVFAAAARFAPAMLRAPATFLVWSMLVLVVGSSFLTASCLFISQPKPFPRLVADLFEIRSDTEQEREARERGAREAAPAPQPSIAADTPAPVVQRPEEATIRLSPEPVEVTRNGKAPGLTSTPMRQGSKPTSDPSAETTGIRQHVSVGKVSGDNNTVGHVKSRGASIDQRVKAGDVTGNGDQVGVVDSQ